MSYFVTVEATLEMKPGYKFARAAARLPGSLQSVEGREPGYLMVLSAREPGDTLIPMLENLATHWFQVEENLGTQ